MKREFRLIGAWIIGIALIIACFPAYTAAASLLEAGSYSADYVVLRAEDDSASIANDYWEKPATVTVAKDGATVRMTINHSKWVKEFSVPSAGGSYTAVKVVSSDDAADKRTVEFRADDLSKPISAKIHVTIEDIGYDHKYTIRFSFDTNSFKLIKAAEKPAESPKETPAAEKDASSSSPSPDVSKPTPTSTPTPASTAKPIPQEEKGTNTAAASAGSDGSKGNSNSVGSKAAGTAVPAEQAVSPAASERPAASETADSAAAEVKEPMASESADPASSNDSASDEAAIADAGNEEAAAIAAVAPIAKEALHPADDNDRNLKGIYILAAVIIAGAVLFFVQRRKRSTRQ
jgi:heme uptake protein IsdC